MFNLDCDEMQIFGLHWNFMADGGFCKNVFYWKGFLSTDVVYFVVYFKPARFPFNKQMLTPTSQINFCFSPSESVSDWYEQL